MDTRRRSLCVTRLLVAGGLLACVGDVCAQFCPGGTTYFSGTYSLAACANANGTCWSTTAFPGSTAVTSNQYPSTNYTCAATTRPAGALENTLYSYDNNGNRLTSVDPLDHKTAFTYDSLNRLTRMLDATNVGTTRFDSDAANNVYQVTDARNNATSYTYSGLNDLLRQTSPDTGVTQHRYDPAGNLQTRTDARGVTATYSYDDINRVIQVIYSKTGTPSETHLFTYDSGANAVGRLVAISSSGVPITLWSYNSQGRVASKAQRLNPLITRTITYGYNAAGQLTSIQTPSGQQIGYGYTNNRVSSIAVNGETLLTGAVTMPFGPLAAWKWGNSELTFREYDLDGRPIVWEFRNGTSVLRKNQRYDFASRIKFIDDPNNPTASQAYDYDELNRLKLAQTANPVTHTQQFYYDGVGNRSSKNVDGSLTNCTYPSNNNHLAMLSGATSRTYSYDDVGNPTTIGSQIYTYNNTNRLVQVQSGGVTIAKYAVNALGQRVSKTVGGVTTFFVYDEQGHLLGEYDQLGGLIQETVWLEDLPVATIRGGKKGKVYYVHADHLGSPRAVTRPSDNAIVWQWDNVDPFGANVANENPAGQGEFKYALRFPGQYYDAETGTHYNWFRDYDSTVGRYVQSDPVGLHGGFNTYIYVSVNPLTGIDPNGLIQIYGNWCGPNWTGGYSKPWDQITIPELPGVKPPIDALDACCQTHDYCHAGCRSSVPCNPTSRAKCYKNCDRVLSECASKSGVRGPREWGVERYMNNSNPDPEDNDRRCPGNCDLTKADLDRKQSANGR